MKTAVTITGYYQSGVDSFTNWAKTRVFDDESKLKDIKDWLKTYNLPECLSEVTFSDVEE